MTVKIGFAEGTCPKCGKTLRRRRPADYAVCDCYRYCVSGDTNLITPEGIIQIKNAKDTQFVLGVKDGKIRWVRNLKWHKYNVYGPLYEILTNKSRLLITHDNPVLTFNGWFSPEKISPRSLILSINLCTILGDAVIEKTLGTMGTGNSETTLWEDAHKDSDPKIFASPKYRSCGTKSSFAQFRRDWDEDRGPTEEGPCRILRQNANKRDSGRVFSRPKRRSSICFGKTFEVNSNSECTVEESSSAAGIVRDRLGIFGGDHRRRRDDNYTIFQKEGPQSNITSFNCCIQQKYIFDGVASENFSGTLEYSKRSFRFWCSERFTNKDHCLSGREMGARKHLSLFNNKKETGPASFGISAAQRTKAIWFPLYSRRLQYRSRIKKNECWAWQEVRVIRELPKAEIRRISEVYDLTTSSENFFANGILIKNCPICPPAYTVRMDPYTPDLTPSTYGPIESETLTGDTDAPLRILYKCPKCGHYSAQLPVEVALT